MTIDFCPKCKGKINFLAGAPANDSNVYCVDSRCGWEAWSENVPQASSRSPGCSMAAEIKLRIDELCPGECWTADNKEHAEMVANEMMDNCMRLISAMRSH